MGAHENGGEMGKISGSLSLFRGPTFMIRHHSEPLRNLRIPKAIIFLASERALKHKQADAGRKTNKVVDKNTENCQMLNC